MPAYNVFFYGALFFLTGVLGASVALHSSILIIVAACAAVFLFVWRSKKEKRFVWLAGLSLFTVAGAMYYTGFTAKRFSEPASGTQIKFSGTVVENPEIKDASQAIVLKAINGEYKGARFLLTTDRSPAYHYGDVLEISGSIGAPISDPFDAYLAKERIVAAIRFPAITRAGEHKGSAIREYLFSFRERVLASFNSFLPQEQAAFLGGLTLGDKTGFSKEFTAAMQGSGTTHLVALSGYNITIIVLAAMSLFLLFFGRKAALLLTALVIVGFVVMTGVEASVVRAAIMGVLILIAKEEGRVFDVRNVVVCAGLIMVLLNPRILVFDVGFELSFLAFFGIVYLEPALQRAVVFFRKEGALSWRKNLLTTSAAQIMVLPVLFGSFGSFSPLSLLSNMLILECVPITMALGFAAGALASISYYAGLAASWFVAPLLYFETGLIKFFGNLGAVLQAPMHWSVAVVYYIGVGYFIWRINRNESNEDKYPENAKSQMPNQ